MSSPGPGKLLQCQASSKRAFQALGKLPRPWRAQKVAQKKCWKISVFCATFWEVSMAKRGKTWFWQGTGSASLEACVHVLHPLSAWHSRVRLKHSCSIIGRQLANASFSPNAPMLLDILQSCGAAQRIPPSPHSAPMLLNVLQPLGATVERRWGAQWLQDVRNTDAPWNEGGILWVARNDFSILMHVFGYPPNIFGCSLRFPNLLQVFVKHSWISSHIFENFWIFFEYVLIFPKISTYSSDIYENSWISSNVFQIFLNTSE